MKELAFLTVLGALTLASCTQDEPVDINKGRAIDFRPEMAARSRGAEITNADLSSISVTAFLGDAVFFDATEFTKGSDGFFTSTPEYYWPGDDSELTFYSYSPVNPGGTVEISTAAKTMTGFSPAAEIADQVDFISVMATGKKSANEDAGVELEFSHRLSQIELQAKTDNEAYVFQVTGVRVGQPVSTGDFDFTTSAWTLGTDKAIYTEEYATPVKLGPTAQSIMGEGGNAMLLPQQLTAWDPDNDGANAAKGAYLAVKLQINTIAGAEVYPFPSDDTKYAWAAIPVNTNWEAGKKYIYTLDFTHGAGNVDPNGPDPGTPVFGGPIKFTVDVQEWTPSNQDVPMTTK